MILGGWHKVKRTTFHSFSPPPYEDLPGLAHMHPEWSWAAETIWRGRHSISSLLHPMKIYLDQLICFQNDLGWLTHWEEEDIPFRLSCMLWWFTWTSSYAPRMILDDWHTEKRKTFHFFSPACYENLPGLAHMLPEWSWMTDTLRRGRHSIPSLLHPLRFTWTSWYAPRMILDDWQTEKRTTCHFFCPSPYEDLPGLAHMLPKWSCMTDTLRRGRHSISSLLHLMNIYLE